MQKPDDRKLLEVLGGGWMGGMGGREVEVGGLVLGFESRVFYIVW